MRVKLWYALVACLLIVGAPQVGAQGGPGATNERASSGGANDVPNPEGKKIRFAFKGATLDQVIDFFSRETGLPVVRETEVKGGDTLDFVSLEAYEMPEALRVLNTILQTRGVYLYVNKDMLYLAKLTEAQKMQLSTYQGTLPENITPDQMVINVLPLENALAKPIADQLKGMVASYGSITPMEAQNSLVIVETAGKIRQLHGIIKELDKADLEATIKIFKIKHTKASALMTPLKALLAEKVQQYVINPQNNQRTLLEQEEIRGLTMSHDDRTNSIVAKGAQTKIDQLEEALNLLDVPSAGQERSVQSVVLARLTPDEAAQHLNRLYQKFPNDQRPTVMPFADLGKVTFVGDEEAIAEGRALLHEIDGGAQDARTEHQITVIPLEHAQPTAIINALRGLLNGRQQSTVKLVPGQDGKSLIVAGLTGDVESVRAIIPVLDSPQSVDRDVRLIRLTAKDPVAALTRAQSLYEKQRDANEPAEDITVDFDPATRMATLVGSPAAINAFQGVLNMVEGNLIVDQETRQIQLTNTRPSAIVSSLTQLANPLLQPRDGTQFVAPKYEPLDQLDTLLVTATSEQFGVIESLIETLDRPNPSDFQFRVVSLGEVTDADALVDRAKQVFNARTAGMPESEREMPTVEVDLGTGNLLVTGRTAGVQLFEQSVSEARRLLPPTREGRLYSLTFAKAADLATKLNELLATTQLTSGARAVQPPEIRIVEPTNSLYVVAETAQHQMIDRFVRDLDQIEPAALPPLRMLQVRAADAQQIANLLRQRYEQRPPQQKREQPVTIDADAATNTLIVTAHEAVFADIQSFVQEINENSSNEPDRTTKIYPLKLAKATDLAAAMERLYPEPPMPRDRFNRPMPHLQEPREVLVTADPNTNSLIIEAPAERMPSFDALVEQLDRVELPPRAELRTYFVENGDLNQIVSTLNQLRDVLVRQPEDGSKPVQVLIQAEPQSRTLIVAGDEVTFQKVEELLTQIKPIPAKRELSVIDVRRGDPQELADRAQQIYKSQNDGQPGVGEVSVEVDRDNSTLLVVADAESMIRFVSIVNKLQESVAPPADVRLVSLEYAKANEVVQFLTDLGTSALSMIGEQVGPAPEYAPIERINSILISAQPEQHPVISALIDNLDKPEQQDMPPLRILQLRSADAQNLAQALMNQYNQRSPDERKLKPVSISADPNTNALVVAAHPDVLPEIQTIVTDLNDTTRVDTEGREIRIFPLRVARAEDLARTIDEMYSEPPMPTDRFGRPQPQLRQPREIVVRADAQTNSLIVDAPVQRMTGFEDLVEQLDRTQIAEETEIRTYRIVHAELDAVSRTLNELARSDALMPSGQEQRTPITISTEPLTQTLVISGPKAIFDRVEQMIDSLDTQHAGPTTSLRFFTLKSAKVDSIAPMLREILVARIREDVQGAGVNADSLLKVTTERKTNTLIISAPEAIMPVVEQLIERLDDPTATLEQPVIRVVPLTFAIAQDVAQSLQPALSGTISDVTGEPMDVNLLASAGSNALIMVGLAADLKKVEELIAPLDQRPSMDALDAKTFELDYADAMTIAPLIERLLTNQLASDPRVLLQQLRTTRGQVDTTPKIQVEADDRTNSLIVSGTKQTVALAETLIAQLDAADDSANKTYELFTPVNANATGLADSVRRVISSTRPTGKRTTLELIAEPQSGSIVVIGVPEETQEAVALLKQWDADALVSPQLDLQILDLDHAQASVVAQTLTPMLRDQSRWPAELRAAVRAGLAVNQPTVTADATTNRVLVSAPTSLMQMARDLTTELDRARGDEAVDVRIFNLTQARAQDVATAIQTAMTQRSQRRPGEPAVGVTPEPSSNSIVVTASAAQLEEIDQIIAKIDQGVAVDQPQIKTVFLKHARAEAVAPIVESLLADENKLNVNDLPTWARVDYLRTQAQFGASDVRVVADTRLNAVVISAPPSVLTVAGEMVAQLDVDPAQDPSTQRTVRVLTIDNADAAELAASLEAIFSEGDLSEAAPTIRVDAASNSLIVRATAGQFTTIEEVARSIDQATISTNRQLQMIPVDPSKATAEEVARTLERLLNRGNGAKVEVITAEELIRRRKQGSSNTEESDTPPREESGPTSDRGSSFRGSLTQWMLLSALGLPQDATATNQDAGGDADITIAVDPATNSLIVIGSPRSVERVRQLALDIQDRLPAQPGTIRYVALPEEVDARGVADVITQTLRRLTPAGGESGDMFRRVSVIPDEANNALVVASNDADFETVGDLIAALAQPVSTDEVTVKVYPLAKVTAERAAESVRNLIASDASLQQNNRRRNQQAERMRELAIRLLVNGREINAVFDPNRIRVTADRPSNALIVMGPQEAIDFIDRYVEVIDQSPAQAQATLKLFALKHAQANDLARTLQGIFQTRFRSLRDQLPRDAVQPDFGSDSRTNTLIVTAAPEQLAEVEALLSELDQASGEARYPLRIVELKHARPQQATQILNQVVLANNQELKKSMLIVPYEEAGILLLRGPDETMQEVDRILAEVDRDASKEFEVRTITVERADASAIARSIQQFYDDRARISGDSRARRKVAIVGDPNSRTLLVAASDTDYETVKQLVERFDSPESTQALEFRVFELKHARATDIQQSIQDLVNDLTWNQGPSFMMFDPFGRLRSSGGSQARGTLTVRADERLNALVVIGEGDKFEVVEQMVQVLDAPVGEGEQRVVRAYPVRRGDLRVIADVLRSSLSSSRDQQINRWLGGSSGLGAVQVFTDERTRTLIVAAPQRQQDDAERLISQLAVGEITGEHTTQIVAIEWARANEIADSVRRFLEGRAEAIGAPRPTATILPINSTNTLIVSAEAQELATIRDMISRLDVNDASRDRVLEIIALKDGKPDEIARIIRDQFGGASGQGIRITPDLRTNSLIVNAPREQFEQAMSLINLLDRPDKADETVIKTFSLSDARADQVVQILTQSLKLDAQGKTSGITIRLEDEGAQPVEVKATVVADRRSNSIIVTGTPESIPVIESLISKVDAAKTATPTEWRIIKLQHALAYDTASTLRRFLTGMPREQGESAPSIDYNEPENQLIISATPGQFEQINELLQEIDKPSERNRVTRTVPLEFAKAESVREALSYFYGPLVFDADRPAQISTRIVANPATNSLLITADESEWPRIEAWLSELDREEYDSSLQLRVLPLRYADAASVARAINEAFQSEVQSGRNQGNQPNRNQPGNADDERRDNSPTMLVSVDEWVRASAEPQTNSVIVSANLQNFRKIESIVNQLDVAEFSKLPAPRLITVRSGNPEELARSLNEVYGQRNRQTQNRRSVVISASREASALIVRSEDEDFDQIRALAEALQQEASKEGLGVHVLKLKSASATRVATAIQEAFQEKAQQVNSPFSIRADSVGNSLIIAASAALFTEIAATVEQLDGLSPAAGQGIFIIDLQHVDPEKVKTIIETIGLHQPPRDDSASRLVSEPIRISVLSGRNSLIVIANPADRETIIGLVKALDAEPKLAETQVRVVALQNSKASVIKGLMDQVLDPADQSAAKTTLARNLQEQIRRLNLRTGNGLGEKQVVLDLSTPVRLIADDAMNAIVIGGAAENIDAIEQAIRAFDQLPLRDPVMVQMFPLENIDATKFRDLIQQMMQQGRTLGTIPGTDVTGPGGSMTGRVLADSIAMSVDERTNTIIVAGKEETIAFIEVMRARLDTQVATGWLEPRILKLTHADATDLSETINAILVEGSNNLPQSTPLQKQVGKIRLAMDGRHVESEVFQPMTRLVVRPDEQLNALILVGTPRNLAVIEELVQMLDIEAASPDATIRIYPVEHASAAKLASTVTQLFNQQVQSKAIRPEDRVIVQADERTNALIVSTSPRSFAVLESLLTKLDTDIGVDLKEIRQIELQNASATRVAQLVQQMMDARLERLQRVQPETAELDKVTIVADTRSNSLLVAAGNDSFEVVKVLAQQLDAKTLNDAGDVTLVSVGEANASRLADTVNQIMQRRYAEMPQEIRNSQQPLVLVDSRSNSLLVVANPEDVGTIQSLVDKLKTAPINPAVGLHVITLDKQRAEELAPRLQRMMQERLRTLGQARTELDTVTIEPYPATNSLIIAASDENLRVVNDLLAVLAQHEASAVPGAKLEVITLNASLPADYVVQVVREMYADEINRTRGNNTVRVSADARLNALLINAPEENIVAIRELVGQLDQTRPTHVIEIEAIPLKSADPVEIVQLIQNVLSGRGIDGRANPLQSRVIQYVRQLDGGAEASELEVNTAVRQQITLTPDQRSSKVIVSAPRDSMKLIKQMIHDLDSSEAGNKRIETFKLVNADAAAMAEILTDLFRIRRSGATEVLKPVDEAVGSVPNPEIPLFNTDLTVVPDERQQLSITVDSRTNTLIVSGAPRYLDLVAEVVRELDNEEANERVTWVYPLKNAVAGEVARVISEFVEEDQRKLVDTLSPDQLGSAGRLLEREVTIVGDDKSNTVLVSANPRYIDRVKAMVEQLDIDPPQVLIQVLFAEITLDSTDDWGVEMASRNRVDSASVNAGFSLFGPLLSGAGVPNLAVSSTDFDLLIRALQSQGRLQVLSNPSIMAANNEQARIQVGENIGRPSGSTTTIGGSQQTQVEFVDTGVILNVTPSINPDGFVRMVISPEISDLTNRSTQVSEDLQVPVLTVRKAETTVTVMDGQTIVLGGLISDRLERRSSKVPLLGDIPFFGNLFRSQSEEARKTELLIVLTPHVITSPSELRRTGMITEAEIDRLSVPEEVKQQIREGAIEGTGWSYDNGQGKTTPPNREEAPPRYLQDPRRDRTP